MSDDKVGSVTMEVSGWEGTDEVIRKEVKKWWYNIEWIIQVDMEAIQNDGENSWWKESVSWWLISSVKKEVNDIKVKYIKEEEENVLQPNSSALKKQDDVAIFIV